MFTFLILTTVLAVGFATSNNINTETTAATNPIIVRDESRHDQYNDHRHDNEHRKRLNASDLDKKHRDPDITHQNKIIKRVHSPDYHEPIRILNYRYMKYGRRTYVRGPGRQIVILPKNVRPNEHKKQHEYNSLIKHFRLNHVKYITKLNRFRYAHHDKDFSRLIPYNKARGREKQRHNHGSEQPDLKRLKHTENIAKGLHNFHPDEDYSRLIPYNKVRGREGHRYNHRSKHTS